MALSIRRCCSLTGRRPRLLLCWVRLAGRRIYLSVRPDIADLLAKSGWEMRDVKVMSRMILDGQGFAPVVQSAERLGPADYEALAGLHRDGEASGENPPFFNAGMLGHGVYFGIREGGDLIAAAGTHVLAEEKSVAAIGNVYTRTRSPGPWLGGTK